MPSLSSCARRAIFLAAASLTLLVISTAAPAQPMSPQTTSTVETTWKLLDYVAVDYDGAVNDGKVVSPGEFSEMNEFTATIARQIASLPMNPLKPELEQRASALHDLVTRKAPGEAIAMASHSLSAAMLKAYPVPVAPDSAPDVSRGAKLFAQNCAACHGATGNGKGPDAATLSTPPVAFADVQRARKRSLAGLDQVISQGIDGTAMQSFADLPDADRWALAFYAGHFAFSPADVARGAALWKSDASIRARIPDLKTLVTTTPAALGRQIGQDKADAVMAYLRANPQTVTTHASGDMSGSIDVVEGKLDASVAAYRQGDVASAKQLALSAYLDGFEPVEPLLGASAPDLMSTIETRMGEYRAAIGQHAPAATISEDADALKALLGDARTALSPQASSGTTAFLGAFTIMVREGLEALLIVVAMLAFLRKAERADALRYVHGGWITALIAGGLTWLLATFVIGISGASRELTEGFGSLLAAAVLLSVGVWMHGKSHADQWQRYIREKLAGAMNRQSGWFLFGLAFVVVYREVFETILFYAALWAQGSGAAILGGAACAAAVLGAIAWAMLRYSRTLPIGTFFRYSSWLMAVLTVVLAGKGVAALQEAGWIGIAPLTSAPRFSLLGVFPTLQSIGAQLVMIVALVVGFAISNRKATQPAYGT
jgi:high-affinity iron transporter